MHHLNYHSLFDVTIDDLAALCGACHSRVHTWLDAVPKVEASSEWKRRTMLGFLSRTFNMLADERDRRGLRLRKKRRRNPNVLAIMEEAASHGLNIRGG